MTLTKNITYSPKEILDADPEWTTPIKLGRGRMPTGGEAHVKTLVAKGYRVRGYDVTSTAAPVSDKAIAEPVVKKSVAAGEKIIEEFTIFFDKREFKAIRKDNGKEIGMAEVCNNCNVSLVQNSCANPTVLNGIAVSIVSR